MGRYLLSLMRAHSGEHGDTKPFISVHRLRHLAYVLDALMYYVRAKVCSARMPTDVSSLFLVENIAA